MQMTAKPASEGFQSGADKYAAYLEILEGRLRCGLVFANLQDFLVLPQSRRSLRGLDLGCGTGATAVRLARLGMHMTLLDSSSAMLDIAKRATREAGVGGRIALNHGDAAQVANLFPAGSFEVVLCHNILEYVDDPNSVLSAAAKVLQSDSGILSILVRNWAGEVFKAGVKTGDLESAERMLTTMWGHESLFGGRVRLFTLDSLQVMTKSASLAVAAERGVRVISDYLPQQISRREEYERIFELERKLSSRPEFAAVARYIQVIARHSCASSSKETGP
ncbi:MAG TPA: methyltransferase domain-containing protein [Terriglobales bacterium]|nr:methyltransferase domain-containing protein [Terriglobales bacterium]